MFRKTVISLVMNNSSDKRVFVYIWKSFLSNLLEIKKPYIGNEKLLFLALCFDNMDVVILD